MNKLTYENVTMRFGDVTALDHVSLTLEPGHIYGLLGRNGAGKSTLLSVTANWRRPPEWGIGMGKHPRTAADRLHERRQPLPHHAGQKRLALVFPLPLWL